MNFSGELISAGKHKLYTITGGDKHAPPVLFLHGNTSSSVFWKDLLPYFTDFRLIAPDLNGFGKTPFRSIRAKTGVADWSDDVINLMNGLGYDQFHLVTHSLGGIVGWHLLAHHPKNLLSLTQIAPGSPYGFGGTKDKDGSPIYDDFAGSGAGISNPELIRQIRQQNTALEPAGISPRWLLRHVIIGKGFVHPREDELVESMLSVQLGDDALPGNIELSQNWPFFSPGDSGIVNAISPKWLEGLAKEVANVNQKVPILWIHGSDDMLVSNSSVSEPHWAGKNGRPAGWPGSEIYPPQPMSDQIERLLEIKTDQGFYVRKHVIKGAGHSPHLKSAESVSSRIRNFWNDAGVAP